MMSGLILSLSLRLIWVSVWITDVGTPEWTAGRWARRRPVLASTETPDPREFPPDAPRMDLKVTPESVRVMDARLIDRKFRAGEVLRERRELKLERERLREAAEAERARRARTRRERLAERASRALQFRMRKKRRQMY